MTTKNFWLVKVQNIRKLNDFKTFQYEEEKESDVSNFNKWLMEKVFLDLEITHNSIINIISKYTPLEHVVRACNDALEHEGKRILSVRYMKVTEFFYELPIEWKADDPNIPKAGKVEIKDVKAQEEAKMNISVNTNSKASSAIYALTDIDGTSLLVDAGNRIFLARRDKKHPMRSSKTRVCISDCARDNFIKSNHGCTEISENSPDFTYWKRIIKEEFENQRNGNLKHAY